MSVPDVEDIAPVHALRWGSLETLYTPTLLRLDLITHCFFLRMQIPPGNVWLSLLYLKSTADLSTMSCSLFKRWTFAQPSCRSQYSLSHKVKSLMTQFTVRSSSVRGWGGVSLAAVDILKVSHSQVTSGATPPAVSALPRGFLVPARGPCLYEELERCECHEMEPRDQKDVILCPQTEHPTVLPPPRLQILV